MDGKRALAATRKAHRQQARLAPPPQADLEPATRTNQRLNCTVPILLKFHKVGSETVMHALDTTLQEQRVARGCPRRVASPEARGGSPRPCACDAAYVCANGQMLAHQTLSDFAASVAPGARDARRGLVARCLPGALARWPKLLAVFREPVARFVSGVMYYARRRERAALRRVPPAQLTRDHFEAWLAPRYAISRGYDFDGYEYTAVMSGMLGPSASTSRRLAERTRAARRNLERWVDAVGVTENMDAFVVLMALTLGWPPRAFGCYSLRNVGPRAPTQRANQSERAERRVSASDLNPRVRSWVRERLSNEIEVGARAVSARALAVAACRVVLFFPARTNSMLAPPPPPPSFTTSPTSCIKGRLRPSPAFRPRSPRCRSSVTR